MIEYKAQRARVEADGAVFIARDAYVDGRFFCPQHAVLRTFSHRDGGSIERLMWVGHEEGGQMEPLIA